jgi:hypothetical protein
MVVQTDAWEGASQGVFYPQLPESTPAPPPAPTLPEAQPDYAPAVSIASPPSELCLSTLTVRAHYHPPLSPSYPPPCGTRPITG